MIYIAMSVNQDINGIQDFMFIGVFDSLEKANNALQKHKDSESGFFQEELYIHGLELNKEEIKKYFDDAILRPKRMYD